MGSPIKNDAQTTCKQAIQNWQTKTGQDPLIAKKVSLICQLPSIKKLDSALYNLTNCEHLSLSTNQIDRLVSFAPLKNLKILSIGRNNLKRFEKLEDNFSSLEELWCSYNQIEKLDGLSLLKKLRVLYLSNNQIKTYDELLKLRECTALEELLLIGNPLYTSLRDANGNEMSKEQCRIEVLKRLPKLKKLDAKVVSELEREQAINNGQQSGETADSI